MKDHRESPEDVHEEEETEDGTKLDTRSQGRPFRPKESKTIGSGI